MGKKKDEKIARKNDLVAMSHFGEGGFIEAYLNATLRRGTLNKREVYTKYRECAWAFGADHWPFTSH